MVRSLRLVALLPFLVTLGSVGCSDDPAAPENVRAGDTGGTSAAGGSSNGGSTSAAGGSSSGGSDAAGGSAGTVAQVNYPSGPYGINVGDVVQDLSFQGLLDPKDVGYKTDATSKISFHDFYNPTGDTSKPIALVVTGAARWCAPCKDEASHSMSYWKYWNPKGVQFLSAVVQDENYGPSTFTDLSAWAGTYKLEYPTTIDPSPPQLGVYFGQDAVPFNMILDLKTMKILYKIAGSIVLDQDNSVLKKATGQ